MRPSRSPSTIGVGTMTFSIPGLLELAKPRITLLALITTFTGMWVAGGGLPDLFLLLVTLTGTGLGAASAATLNNYIDRHIDKKMKRTRDRVLPAGNMSPTIALIYGITLGTGGVLLLGTAVNPLAAALLSGTILFYLFVYTLWLKRTTPLSTEIGGIAGALPPVIGWVAVTGHIEGGAVALFALMFLWQPPHFWALGLHYRDDYKKADLPRLPVVRSNRETSIRILIYTILTVIASLSLYMMGISSHIYLIIAGLAGLTYLIITIRYIYRGLDQGSPMRLFSYSNLYLTIVFAGMIVDTAV